MKINQLLIKRASAFCMAIAVGALSCLPSLPVCAKETVPEVTLRVCNWEEYIDEGDWDEDEIIDLESGDIIGENSMVEDFEEWYLETYGIKVNVEYSCFGTNEELYNMLTIGDVFDVVCPSEYMMMKFLKEDKLVPFSKEFFDESNPNNYYIRGLSPYIANVFNSQKLDGHAWSEYMAGYMWGLTGIVYNPEKVTEEEASTWDLLNNPKFRRQVTIKDSVRECYFAAMGTLKKDLLTSDAFKNDANYHQNLENEINEVTPEVVEQVQNYLQDVKNNTYSFESDAGKADMITGKVVANYQWSGDAAYTLDQAEEDDYYLCFAVPQEATNIYFDGWTMLKAGIKQDERKQHAAEAFINFVSRPDNAIRNMYYIGYTSVISGGEDNRMFEYADWCYGAEEDEEDTAEYPLGYFFSGDNEDKDYVITAPTEQLNRQLYSQYPDQDAISRSSIMTYFDEEQTRMINNMWVNVRCYNIKNIPIWAWILTACLILGVAGYFVNKKKQESEY